MGVEPKLATIRPERVIAHDLSRNIYRRTLTERQRAMIAVSVTGESVNLTDHGAIA